MENNTCLVVPRVVMHISFPDRKTLKKLQVVDCGLQSIDDEYPELLELDATNNRLTRLPFAPKLEIAVLKNNCLNKIYQNMCMFKQLRILDLSHNILIEVPPAIWELKALVFLSLSNNQIQRISPGILNLTRLEQLYLQNNHIEDVPSYFEKLGLVLLNLESNHIFALTHVPATLTHLNCERNRLKSIDIKTPNLEVLNVSHNSLWELQPFPRLKILHATENELRAFPTPLPELEIAMLGRNDISKVPDLSTMPNLKILDLCTNRLTTFQALNDAGKLRTINLSDNFLRQEPEHNPFVEYVLTQNLFPKVPTESQDSSPLKRKSETQN